MSRSRIRMLKTLMRRVEILTAIIDERRQAARAIGFESDERDALNYAIDLVINDLHANGERSEKLDNIVTAFRLMVAEKRL